MAIAARSSVTSENLSWRIRILEYSRTREFMHETIVLYIHSITRPVLCLVYLI
jgi:hypothetical protein